MLSVEERGCVCGPTTIISAHADPRRTNLGIDALFLHINYQLVLRRHRLEAERRRKERESVHLSDASRDEDGEGRSQEKRKGKQGPCCSV